MNSGKLAYPQRILSLAFASRRMGFVIAHGGNLLDYGVKDIPATSKKLALSKVQHLIARYQPSHVFIQDMEDIECKLGISIMVILSELETMFIKQEIAFKAVSKSDVRENLGLMENACKQEVVAKIATMYPQLQNLLPPPRKLWEGEHRNIPILVAASLFTA